MISTAEKMTNFTFKMDKKTREQYSALCDSFGLSMSAATLALVRQAVRSQTMTFSMRDANGFTPEEAAELKRRIDDVTKGKVTQHSIIED
ncbi:MAG: damage-inducible protein J [Lachnospiraceae bacterium]|nr:damage-inducible protein J [Lachnospiraceae bacterium]